MRKLAFTLVLLLAGPVFAQDWVTLPLVTMEEAAKCQAPCAEFGESSFGMLGWLPTWNHYYLLTLPLALLFVDNGGSDANGGEDLIFPDLNFNQEEKPHKPVTEPISLLLFLAGGAFVGTQIRKRV